MHDLANPFDFRDQTVLVTGATAGIGLAVAHAFAAAGARLILMARGAAAGPALCERLRHEGAADAVFVAGDVAHEADVERAVRTAMDRHGRLDIAVNNAGVIESAGTGLHERSAAEFDHVFGTNVRGLFFCLKHELRAMRSRTSGVIVNVSSVAGARAAAGIGLYAASKHAVEALTRSAALEVAELGIRVLSLQPHATESPMLERFVGMGETAARKALRQTVPMGRLAQPEEQAQAVLWLCSPAASFMTGSSIAVDGGFLAR